jgi:hypothetical protein
LSSHVARALGHARIHFLSAGPFWNGLTLLKASGGSLTLFMAEELDLGVHFTCNFASYALSQTCALSASGMC